MRITRRRELSAVDSEAQQAARAGPAAFPDPRAVNRVSPSLRRGNAVYGGETRRPPREPWTAFPRRKLGVSVNLGFPQPIY